jgi:5-formyltetrahydrofolate cyclo-ligase
VDSGSVTERLADSKRALRKAVLAARAEMSPAHRADASAGVVQRLLELPEVRSAAAVAAFVGVGTELDTTRLLDDLHGRGTRVLLPVLLADDSLGWRPYAGRDLLVTGRRGLREPSTSGGDPAPQLREVDVVVVPGVCYDFAGRRLGRGGGSYDRALAGLPGRVLRVGVALDGEIIVEVPAAPHDEPVDVVVTPTRTIRCDGG